MNEVCGGLQYESHPSDSFIIHYGDRGDKFYIILKGSVSVWLPVPINEMRRPMESFLSQTRNADKIEFRFLR